MWRIFDEIKFWLKMLGIVLGAILGALVITSHFILMVLVIYCLIFQPELVGELIGNWFDKFEQGLK